MESQPLHHPPGDKLTPVTPSKQHRKPGKRPMRVNATTIAATAEKLERVFLNWQNEASKPFGGDRMDTIDMKLLVVIVKEYDRQSAQAAAQAAAREAAAAASASRAAAAAAASSQSSYGASFREGSHHARRAEFDADAARRGPARRRQGTREEFRHGGAGGTAFSHSSFSSQGDGEHGESDMTPEVAVDAARGACEEARGAQCCLARGGFLRSGEQSALRPGYFRMDDSEWLERLAEAMPAVGLDEVHYVNAAGYWLGLSSTAASMAAETTFRSKDEITGLLAFSQILSRVAERILSKRMQYFDTLVTRGAPTAAEFAARVEAASGSQSRQTSDIDGEMEAGPKFNSAQLLELFPPSTHV